MHAHHKYTAHAAIVVAPVPAKLHIPYIQHIGARTQALVSVGDSVYRGQCIANADAFVTASIHSPISGKVVAIDQCIVIENDGLDTLDPAMKPYPNLEMITVNELRQALRDAGIVGMGGATFPTHVKAAPPEDKKVDTIILNAAECEPYLTADHRVMLEHAEQVVFGFKAMAKAVGASRLIVGIEDNKKDAVKALRQAGMDKIAQIKVLPTVYPTGAEKVLVRKTTGRVVGNKQIPLDVGVMVSNVGTVYQFAHTLKTGMPLMERVVTVGGLFKNPGNYLVRLGTLLSDLVQLPDVLPAKYRFIVGGPMMGQAIPELNVPVIKGTSGILLLAEAERVEYQCIRCGRCVDICPIGLQAYQDKRMDECMECGLCAYVCPANRYLVQKAKQIKLKLKKR